MDRSTVVAAVLVLLSSGCVGETDSFALSIVLKNSRDVPADFRVRLENASGVPVWTWNQTVGAGDVERSGPRMLPDGLFEMFAFTDDAGCSRGPGLYEAAKITLSIELPELGRTSRSDGRLWPSDQLNCHYTSEDGRWPWI